MTVDSSPRPGSSVYLDHAAATPLRPEVAEAMQRAAHEAFANPSSPHAAGRRARAVLEESRERILSLIGGQTSGSRRDRLVFTSGATEANRLAVIGSGRGMTGEGGLRGAVACSAREHSSVALAAACLAADGWVATTLSLDSRGSAAAAATAFAMTHRGRPLLLCTTPVCGQTGIAETAWMKAAAMENLAAFLVHADATQAAAWIDLSFHAAGWTTLALAPHKFGGPRGIGAVVVRGDVPLSPVTPGPQELGLRGGTEAVALAAGFARAWELAVAEREATRRRVSHLRDLFEQGVVAAAEAAGIETLVVGRASDRAPHITTIAFRGLDRQSVVMAADLAGVCLATGTACASGSSEPAAAIVALGLPDWVPHAAVRASIGPTTSADDVQTALARLDRVFRGLASRGLHNLVSDR
ncbi:MAG: cysteine desulfurase family protein [Pirellulales bacterium]